MHLLHRVLGISRSSYYYHLKGRDDLPLLARIEEVPVRFLTYAYRRVAAQLPRQGSLGAKNAKRVRRVTRESDRLVRGKHRLRTTHSRHGHPRNPNLSEGVEVVWPDQVWCVDITCIRVQQEFIYLAIVRDVFTGALREWALSRYLSGDLARVALEQALADRCPEIHHPGQGALRRAGVHGAAGKDRGADQRGGPRLGG